MWCITYRIKGVAWALTCSCIFLMRFAASLRLGSRQGTSVAASSRVPDTVCILKKSLFDTWGVDVCTLSQPLCTSMFQIGSQNNREAASAGVKKLRRENRKETCSLTAFGLRTRISPAGRQQLVSVSSISESGWESISLERVKARAPPQVVLFEFDHVQLHF